MTTEASEVGVGGTPDPVDPGAGPGYALLQMQEVTRRFRTVHGVFTAVDRVSMELDGGSAIGVVGESGSGKSTLGRMAVGLDRPTTGTVSLNGRSVAGLARSRADRRYLRQTVQLIGQDSTSSFDPRLTVRQSLRLPLRRLRGMSTEEADATVDETLTSLGLSATHADRSPGELSGGQRQRASLARALVVRPRLLVCDEVVSALDVSVQGEVLNLLKEYCTTHGAGLLFISHGLPATAFACRELVVMRAGRIVERGPTEQVLTEPGHGYTRQLIAAFGGRRDGPRP